MEKSKKDTDSFVNVPDYTQIRAVGVKWQSSSGYSRRVPSAVAGPATTSGSGSQASCFPGCRRNSVSAFCINQGLCSFISQCELCHLHICLTNCRLFSPVGAERACLFSLRNGERSCLRLPRGRVALAGEGLRN